MTTTPGGQFFMHGPPNRFTIKDQYGNSIHLTRAEALVLLNWLKENLSNVLSQSEFHIVDTGNEPEPPLIM